jgi:hypothetical protein
MICPPPDDEETVDEPYGNVFRLLELDPEKIAEGEHRRQTALELFEALMQAPAGQHPKLLCKARFRSLDLLDLLLETSHESQIADSPRAEDLASLAARLAALLAEGDQEAAAALPLAFCLGANARRLGNDPEGADALLAKAAPFVHFTSERAIYCRIAGLVRWEQGRADEADALLQQAARLYGWEGLSGEEGACQALLGLLRLEEPGLGNPLAVLAPGWSAMGREIRPRVALRAGLSLAACYAERDQPELARHLLWEVRPLFSAITDERELVRIYGFEGRALARLGEREEALQVLEAVRRKLVQEPSPAEAALASLDLALVLAESGRAVEIEDLAVALETCFPEEPAAILSAGGIASFGDLAISGEPHLREAATDAGVTLRRTFRMRRVPLGPLPFA